MPACALYDMGIDQSSNVDAAAVYRDADGQRYYLFEQTYDSVFRDVIDDLAADVAADYDPDTVVWINKGGASLGPRVAHYFGELPVGSITAESYEDGEQGDLTLYDHALDQVRGNVLLMDDIADSGRTLKAVEEELDAHDRVEVVRTAAIHVSDDCNHPPDYRHETVPDDIWVVYEWEEIPDGIQPHDT